MRQPLERNRSILSLCFLYLVVSHYSISVAAYSTAANQSLEVADKALPQDVVAQLMARMDRLEEQHKREKEELESKISHLEVSKAVPANHVSLLHGWRELKERNPQLTHHEHDQLLLQLGSSIDERAYSRIIVVGGIMTVLAIVMIVKNVAQFARQYQKLEEGMQQLEADLLEMSLELKCNTNIGYYKIISFLHVHKNLILQARDHLQLHEMGKCVEQMKVSCLKGGFKDGYAIPEEEETAESKKGSTNTDDSLASLRMEVEKLKATVNAHAAKNDLPGTEGNLKESCSYAAGEKAEWEAGLKQQCSDLNEEIDKVVGMVDATMENAKAETLDVCKDLREFRNEFYPGKTSGEDGAGTSHTWDTSIEEGIIENINEDSRQAMGIALPALLVAEKLGDRKLEDLPKTDMTQLRGSVVQVSHKIGSDTTGQYMAGAAASKYKPKATQQSNAPATGATAAGGAAAGGGAAGGSPTIHLGVVVGAVAQAVGVALEIINYLHGIELTNRKDYMYNAAINQQCTHMKELSAKVAHQEVLFSTAEGLFLTISQHAKWSKSILLPPLFRDTFRSVYYKYLGNDVFMSKGYLSHCENQGVVDPAEKALCNMAVLFAKMYMGEDMKPLDVQLAFEAKTWTVPLMGLLRSLKTKLVTYGRDLDNMMTETGCDPVLYVDQARFERELIFVESQNGGLLPQKMALTDDGKALASGKTTDEKGRDDNAEKSDGAEQKVDEEDRLKEKKKNKEGGSMNAHNLHFTSNYNIMIEVQSARNIRPMDNNGLSDPYGVVSVGTVRGKDKKAFWTVVGRTKVMKGNLEPVWNDMISVNDFDPMRSMVKLCIYDRDMAMMTGGDDEIGCQTMTFEELSGLKSQDAWFGYRARKLPSLINKKVFDLPLGTWPGDKKYNWKDPLPCKRKKGCGNLSFEARVYREREAAPPKCRLNDVLTCVAAVQSWFCDKGTQFAPEAHGMKMKFSNMITGNLPKSAIMKLPADATPGDVVAAGFEDEMRKSSKGIMEQAMAEGNGASSGIAAKISEQMKAHFRVVEMALLRRRFKGDKKMGLELKSANEEDLLRGVDIDDPMSRMPARGKDDDTAYIKANRSFLDELNKGYMMTAFLYHLNRGNDVNPGSQVFRKRIVPLAEACISFIHNTDSAILHTEKKRRKKMKEKKEAAATGGTKKSLEDDHANLQCEYMCKQKVGKFTARNCVDFNNNEVTVKLSTSAIVECRPQYCVDGECGCNNKDCQAIAKIHCNADPNLCISDRKPEFVGIATSKVRDSMDCTGGDEIVKYIGGLEEAASAGRLKWFLKLFYTNLRCDIDLITRTPADEAPPKGNGDFDVSANDMYTNTQLHVNGINWAKDPPEGSYVKGLVTPGLRNRSPITAYISDGVNGPIEVSKSLGSRLKGMFGFLQTEESANLRSLEESGGWFGSSSKSDKKDKSDSKDDSDDTPKKEKSHKTTISPSEAVHHKPGDGKITGRRTVVITPPATRGLVDLMVMSDGDVVGFGRQHVRWTDDHTKCENKGKYPCIIVDKEVTIYEVPDGDEEKLLAMQHQLSGLQEVVVEKDTDEKKLPKVELVEMAKATINVVMSRPMYDPSRELDFIHPPSERSSDWTIAQESAEALETAKKLSGDGTGVDDILHDKMLGVRSELDTTIKEKDMYPVVCEASQRSADSTVEEKRYGISTNGEFYYAPAKADMTTNEKEWFKPTEVVFDITCSCKRLGKEITDTISVLVFPTMAAHDEWHQHIQHQEAREKLAASKGEGTAGANDEEDDKSKDHTAIHDGGNEVDHGHKRDGNGLKEDGESHRDDGSKRAKDGSEEPKSGGLIHGDGVTERDDGTHASPLDDDQSTETTNRAVEDLPLSDGDAEVASGDAAHLEDKAVETLSHHETQKLFGSPSAAKEKAGHVDLTEVSQKSLVDEIGQLEKALRKVVNNSQKSEN